LSGACGSRRKAASPPRGMADDAVRRHMARECHGLPGAAAPV
jgi:hypothetical protein